MPYTTLVAGTTITASWANANVRDQAVTPFATASARSSAITTPVEGMLTYRTDADILEFYDGTRWIAVGHATGASTAASDTTTSTTYTDLGGGAGPTVTVDTDTAAEVTISCTLSNSAGNHAAMSFAISGATTLAAADARGIFWAGTATLRLGATFLVTGLTPGSNIFTAKYRVNISGTGTFVDRNIHVRPC